MIKRGPVIAGIAALVAILLTAVILVMPKNSQVSAATTELTEAEAKEAKLHAQLLALEELARKGPILVRQLNDNEELIPKQADTPGLIRILKLVATNNGMDFAVLGQTTPTPGEGFSTIGLNIQVSGRFDQTAQYLYDLENLDRAVKVVSVAIASGALSGGLTTTMSAETFTTDQSTGPGGQSGSQDHTTATA